jgi:hypothetical protein
VSWGEKKEETERKKKRHLSALRNRWAFLSFRCFNYCVILPIVKELKIFFGFFCHFVHLDLLL